MTTKSGPGLRIGAPVRELKRRLGPTAWAVLEDVALDAVPDEEGRLVATTSTRRIAENLGLAPGTASRALSRLREVGLVSFVRQSGAGGRFGLSAYVLGTVPGVAVGGDKSSSHDADPSTEPPRPVQPCVVEPRVVDEHMEAEATKAVPRRRRPAGRAPAVAAQLSILDSAAAAEHDTESRRR